MKRLGWTIDFRKLRVYLKDKYEVEKAFVFLGYLPNYTWLYSQLESEGYILVFKKVGTDKGVIKANVDVELTLSLASKVRVYRKAVIVTGDGDFLSVVNYLLQLGKLEVLLVPSRQSTSQLLLDSGAKTRFLEDIKGKLVN